MANLAQTEERRSSLPQKTFNRETTMPRGSTDLPDAEVNARIIQPNTSGNNAAALAKILGVAAEAGSEAFSQDQQRRDNRDAAQAALDFSEGSKDDKRFAKSIAYRNAWQLQGAKKLAIDVGAEVADKVSQRLNDSDNPATLDDIDGIIESTFQAHTTDAQGNLLDFGTPEAKITLANALQEVRSKIIPAASATIRQQQDTRFLGTWADNSVTEYYRGAPIGAILKNDPLAPLPDAATPAPYVYSGEPLDGSPSVASGSLVEPFKGFSRMAPTSVMGAPRQGGSRHNGEDYPIQTGTPLVAPLSGTVISTPINSRGGNQVRIRLDNGAIVGYAHLSELKVKAGDKVSAGEIVGLSGATGDATGPHVHMTVEVNHKKVSPKHYFETTSGSTGLASAPAATPTANNQLALVSSPTQGAATQDLPPFNFERAMSELPPSIDKGEAKKFLLQSLFNQATAKGDIGILTGLEDSRKKDGSPSFTPDEVALIQKAREEIANKAEVDAGRAQRELWKQNGDTLLTAMVSGNPPSDDVIASAAQSGLIDPSTAYTLIDHNRAARNEAAREAKADQREADMQADAGYDAFVAGEASRMSVGDFSGPSADELFKAGKLGPPGKKALGRYRQLQAATRSGEERNRENPLYGQYLGQLRMEYGGSGNDYLLAPQFRSQTNGVNFYAMTAYFKSRVSKGLDPEEAYLETVSKFGPPTDSAAARKKLLLELRAKKAAGS